MNDDFLNFLATRGASVAPLPDEAAGIIVPLTEFSMVRASGEGAADFLQNLLTNDARKLAPDRAQWSGLCSPKGRLLASFLVWRAGEDYLLQLSGDIAPAILKKLSMYILRSKVVLTAEPACAIGMAGASALEFLAARALLPDADFGVLHTEQASVIRLSPARAVVVAGSDSLRRLVEDADSARLALAPTSSWDALTIREGVPVIRQGSQEAHVPQMVNFDLVGGVNFKKGCYPGQEIVARTQYLGKLKKRMFRARSNAPAPAIGAPLFGVEFADQACGEILLAAPTPEGCEVLAVVQLSSKDAGAVRLGEPAGPALEWLPLPYALEPQ